MKVELRSVQIVKAMSEETLCFTAQIYIEGVKAGAVSNRGQGGPHRFDWADRDLGRAFEAFALTRPTRFDFEKADQWVSDLVGDFDQAATLKRLCRGSLVYRVAGTPEGQWTQVRVADSPAARLRATERETSLGHTIVEWANDRLLAVKAPSRGTGARKAH